MEKKDIIIGVEHISKSYVLSEEHTVHALSDVSFAIKKGEFVSVMGPSGSGKTTLLNMIGALDYPTEGEILINGTKISKMKDKQLSNLRLKEIGFIFQFYNLVPVLTAQENIELPMRFAGIDKDVRKKKISHLLDVVNLKKMAHMYPSELSGGEQQRIAIARALCNDPAILIADEPTGELDTKMGKEILSVLRGLNKDLNQTILMVTHDPAVGNMAERHIKMLDGRIRLDSYK